MFFRVCDAWGKSYLMLVESVRVDGKPRQKAIANLGQLEPLRESGRLDKLLRSMAKYSENLTVIPKSAAGETPAGFRSAAGTGGAEPRRAKPGAPRGPRLPGLD